MKFYNDIDKLFDKYEFEAFTTDVDMFNQENELKTYTENYIDGSGNSVLYIDGKKDDTINTPTELFQKMKENGFGQDYTVTWSMYYYSDDNGNEFVVFEIITNK